MSFNKWDGVIDYTVQERPHITFLSHLTVPDEADMRVFLNRLKEIAGRIKPFRVVTGELTYLGCEGAHPAIRIVDTNNAAAGLHFALVEVAEQFGYELQYPEFAGEKFFPHISQSQDRLSLSHNEGEEVLIDSLTVSEHRGEVLFEDVHDIVTYPLSG